jgi:hypothetical protein
MSSGVIARIRFVACLTIFAAVSACASGGANLVKEGRLTIETEAPEEITLSVKGAYEENEQIEIKGVVWWQRHSPDKLYSAHIDIEIVGPDGTVSTEEGVPLRRLFVHRATRQSARFTAHVETEAREDSTIRLTFHQGVHDEPAGGMDLSAPPPGKGHIND